MMESLTGDCRKVSESDCWNSSISVQRKADHIWVKSDHRFQEGKVEFNLSEEEPIKSGWITWNLQIHQARCIRFRQPVETFHHLQDVILTVGDYPSSQAHFNIPVYRFNRSGFTYLSRNQTTDSNGQVVF
ncbi:MAG: hypothetical protein SRB2_00133 [Desulfobacteraceae bacterium Eth-SRB2]|nr:MAG: hypothetical protein SRB2_00133 [Desulfobacteraceae bacterium Eth-SRB2]